MFDGSTWESSQYISTVATFPASNACEQYFACLSFSFSENEKIHSAEEHTYFINWVLGLYGKSINKVVAIIADNCENQWVSCPTVEYWVCWVHLTQTQLSRKRFDLEAPCTGENEKYKIARTKNFKIPFLIKSAWKAVLASVKCFQTTWSFIQNTLKEICFYSRISSPSQNCWHWWPLLSHQEDKNYNEPIL